jgi:hypothetical protein
MGLILDNSGSMDTKRQEVEASVEFERSRLALRAGSGSLLRDQLLAALASA